MSGRAAMAASALVALLGVAPAATAQEIVLRGPVTPPSGRGSGGCNVGRGFECVYLRANDRSSEGTEAEWYRAVVLWRSGVDARATRVPLDTLQARLIREQARDLRRGAEDRGNQYLGGSSSGRWYSAEVTGGGYPDPWKPPRMLDTLTVLGESFTIPMRDTMVVVMVEGTEGGETPPRVAGHVSVPTILVTSTHKTWRSGDTTFIVRPPPESRRELETFLRAIPEVRAFLGRAP